MLLTCPYGLLRHAKCRSYRHRKRRVTSGFESWSGSTVAPKTPTSRKVVFRDVGDSSATEATHSASSWVRKQGMLMARREHLRAVTRNNKWRPEAGGGSASGPRPCRRRWEISAVSLHAVPARPDRDMEGLTSCRSGTVARSTDRMGSAVLSRFELASETRVARVRTHSLAESAIFLRRRRRRPPPKAQSPRPSRTPPTPSPRAPGPSRRPPTPRRGGRRSRRGSALG